MGVRNDRRALLGRCPRGSPCRGDTNCRLSAASWGNHCRSRGDRAGCRSSASRRQIGAVSLGHLFSGSEYHCYRVPSVGFRISRHSGGCSMAQVALQERHTQLIDDYLEYLLREWQMLDWVAAEWDSWEEHERLNFVVEWPIREDRLRQLHRWKEQGLFSPKQQREYDRLHGMIEQQRSTLDRLLAE
jgi:hypothetical protein